MCLIAHRAKEGSHIPNTVIDYNKVVNPDGFGLMWRGNDGVETAKYAPDEFELFRNQLKALDVTGAEYAAHWRNATHGELNRDMAHPFVYEDLSGTPIALMHNGIIDIDPPKGWSDTAAFTHQVLAQMQYGWWHDNALRFLVEQAVGWSRLLLFAPDETVTLNEDAWHLDDAIRFSSKPWKPMGYTYVGKGGKWTTKSSTKSDNGVTVYKPSWENWFDDDDEDGAYKDTPAPRDETSVDERDWGLPISWVHQDHVIYPVDDYDPIKAKREDVMGQCECLDCEALGDYYVIDQNLIVDMQHQHVVVRFRPPETSEEEALWGIKEEVS